MKISKAMLENAVESGIISTEQSEKLWLFFETKTPKQSQINISNLLYYLGGFVAISSITIFTIPAFISIGSYSIFLALVFYLIVSLSMGIYFFKQDLHIPASLCFIFITALTPLLISSGIEFLHPQDSVILTTLDYFAILNKNLVVIQCITFLTALTFFMIFRIPLLMMPIGIISWYLFFTLPKELLNLNIPNYFSINSSLYGFLTIALAIAIDLKTKRRIDYTFWLYFFGVIAAWLGISMPYFSELYWVLYAGVNILFLLLGVIFYRNIFFVFGGIGVLMSLGHLVILFVDHFKLNWDFMFVFFTLLGFGIIKLGLLINKNKEILNKKIQEKIPEAFKTFYNLQD